MFQLCVSEHSNNILMIFNVFLSRYFNLTLHYYGWVQAWIFLGKHTRQGKGRAGRDQAKGLSVCDSDSSAA